ncbi:hypothetical protein THAOC_07641, partial [Thalassiosira oceanica]
MNRVMRKGLHDAYGKDDDESTTLFVKTNDRKKCAHSVAQGIVDLAASDSAVFEMVMPQLKTPDPPKNKVQQSRYGEGDSPSEQLGYTNCAGLLVGSPLQRDSVTLFTSSAFADEARLRDQRHSKETPIGAYHVLDFSTQWPQGSSIRGT